MVASKITLLEEGERKFLKEKNAGSTDVPVSM